MTPDVPFTIDPLDPADEAAVAAYVAIRNAVTPENPDAADQVAWEGRAYPGAVWRFLARDGAGTPVGTASTGRIWMHGPEYERFWLGLWVLPGARRQGIGSALVAGCSGVARSAGKTGFQTELSERHPDGHRFLAARGFTEIDRTKVVRLPLAGREPPDIAPPPGIRLTTLAAERDLLPGVHQVALEAFPDVPTGGEPVFVGTLEEFAARDVDRPGIPADGFPVAVDEATGEVAGYASLIVVSDPAAIAWHDMTAVRPAWRGRGIAGALKRATIAWAIVHGLEELDTGNDETNAPMRAVNRALGYEPAPDLVGLHGPLAVPPPGA